MTLKAIVFDFDGVIADSERLHHQSLAAIATPLGVDLDYDHYLKHYVSYDDRDSIRTLLSQVRGGPAELAAAPDIPDEQLALLMAEKAMAFEQALGESIPTIPGVEAFLAALPPEMPLAIGTGSSRRDLTHVLNKLGLAQRFAVTVCADDVAHSKPDPETYRSAVQQLATRFPQLQLSPEQCLAIEDTPGGIESARAAGLFVLGLTTTCQPDRLTRAHRIAPDFTSLSLEVLAEWFG